MNADEMLNELGFFKSEEKSNSNYLTYINNSEFQVTNDITFYYDNKSFEAYEDIDVALEIDVDLLKAIITKEKELGWID